MSGFGDVVTLPAPSARFRFNAPSVSMMGQPRFPPPQAIGEAGTSEDDGGAFAGRDFSAYYVRPAYRFKVATSQDITMDEGGGPGRRLRRNLSNVRRHVDFISNVLNYVEKRVWCKTERGRGLVQPDILYASDVYPPSAQKDSPIDCVLTKFVRTATNKVKCPIYDICWTTEGRRLITGASTGEFTLWNGTAFNFETILQAHDVAIRALKWSHNGLWLISADQDGFLKYWQPNMNNVHMYQAHKEAVRSLSFAPMDGKLTTGSDDGTVRIWDFVRCAEERIMRGHGSDVRSVDWHPTKGLVVSGSRDAQQPVKIWDPKTGQCLATMHDHKNAVTAVQWNLNGNWLLSTSRDHLIKLYDIRMMREVKTFRGHKKEVTSVSWHPVHEGMFVSGGGDGSLAYWSVTNEKEVGLVEHAHDQAIWTLKWHPVGHILASGSNDNNTKFWTRNKPGDTLEDFHNMATAAGQSTVMGQTTQTASQRAASGVGSSGASLTQSGEKMESGTENSGFIPGMGLEEDVLEQMMVTNQRVGVNAGGGIGLGPDGSRPALLPSDPNSMMGQNLMLGGGGIVGAKKTLIKQPPPKKTQREFEKMWNVSKPMGPSGAGDDPIEMTESAPPQGRKSLLGLPPPGQMPPGPRPPMMRMGGLGPIPKRSPLKLNPTTPPDIDMTVDKSDKEKHMLTHDIQQTVGPGLDIPPQSRALGRPPPQLPTPPRPELRPPGPRHRPPRPPPSWKTPVNPAMMPPPSGRFAVPPQAGNHPRPPPPQFGQHQIMDSGQRQSSAGMQHQMQQHPPPINNPPPRFPSNQSTASIPHQPGADIDLRNRSVPPPQQDQDFRRRNDSSGWAQHQPEDQDLRRGVPPQQQQLSRDPRQRQVQPQNEARDPRKRPANQENSQNDDRSHPNPKRKWQQEYEAEESEADAYHGGGDFGSFGGPPPQHPLPGPGGRPFMRGRGQRGHGRGMPPQGPGRGGVPFMQRGGGQLRGRGRGRMGPRPGGPRGGRNQ